MKKMKNMKKLIGLLLSVTLILTMLPLAYADDAATNYVLGDGSKLTAWASEYKTAGFDSIVLAEQTYTGPASYAGGSTWGGQFIADGNTLTAGLYDVKAKGATLLWTFKAPQKMGGIVIDLEAIYGRQKYELSYYNVFVTDLAGKNHILFDMNYLASGSYAVNVSVPESIGAVKAFGIEVYSNAKVTEMGGSPVSGYTSLVVNELYVYGKALNFTSGNSAADYLAFNNAYLQENSIKRIDYSELTESGSVLFGGLSGLTDNKLDTSPVWNNGVRNSRISLKLSSPSKLKALTIGTEKLYGRDTYDYCYYKVFVKDTAGNTHEVFNMNWKDSSNYFDIPIPESAGMVDSIIFNPYTVEEVKAIEGITDDSVTISTAFALNDIGIFAYNYATVYENAENNSNHMQAYVDFLNADTAANGGEVLNPLLTSNFSGANKLYNFQGDINITDNGRGADFVWSYENPMDVTAIGLVTEKNPYRGWDSISWYKVYVTDMADNKHYLFDMNHASSVSKYSVNISVPETIGRIKNIGIDQYSVAELEAAKGSSVDDTALMLMEFAIVGKASALVSQGKTVTYTSQGGMYSGTPENLTDGSDNTSAMLYALQKYTTPCYFLIDLGAEMPIADVKLVSRNYPGVGELDNLQVRATNDPAASFNDMTQLCKITDTFPKNNPYPSNPSLNQRDSRWASSYATGNEGNFRYIAIGNVNGERTTDILILSEASVYAFTGEAGAPEVAINDAEGNRLAKVEDGAAVTAVATVTKGTDTPDAMMLVLAQYNGDGKLMAVNYKDIDTTEMGMWASDDFDTAITVDGDGYIRAFVLESDTLRPVGDVQSVGEENFF